MRYLPQQLARIPYNIYLCSAFLILVSSVQIYADVYSDEQLLNFGKSAYDQSDFLNAAIYLFAYSQRIPMPEMLRSNPEFANQLQAAWQFSVNYVELQFRKLNDDIDRLRQGQPTLTFLSPKPPPLNIPPEKASKKELSRKGCIARLKRMGLWPPPKEEFGSVIRDHCGRSSL
jgi:hypothetical protein